jgi:hypothetical protein
MWKLVYLKKTAIANWSTRRIVLFSRVISAALERHLGHMYRSLCIIPAHKAVSNSRLWLLAWSDFQIRFHTRDAIVIVTVVIVTVVINLTIVPISQITKIKGHLGPQRR